MVSITSVQPVTTLVDPSVPNYSDVIRPGDFVLLFPWHLLDEYSANLYGKVTKVEANALFIKTRAVTTPSVYAATLLRVQQHPVPPRKVTNVEVHGLQTGRNLYKAMMFEWAGEFLHGQVVDYENKPAVVSVLTKAGIVSISLTEAEEIPAPLALLFFAQTWSTSEWNKGSLHAAHQLVMNQIKNLDLSVPVERMVECAFAGIGSPPTEAQSWWNNVTGDLELCRPMHAVLFLRLEEQWSTAPSGLMAMLGDQWCADPSPGVTTPMSGSVTGDLQDTCEAGESAQGAALVTQSPVTYVPVSKPKRTMKGRAPEAEACRAAVPEQPAEDVFSVHDEEIGEDDWDEELSQASEAVTRCLNSDGATHTGKQSIRSLLGLTDASFVDGGRKAKKLHYPTVLNNIMSRAFHSADCNRMDAQSLIESYTGARFPWNVHPYMSIRLRNAQFGITGVRGFMFRRVEERERRSWILEHAEFLQDYGENCKIFDLPTLKTKQELVEAYSNLTYYWSLYGSELARNFGSRLQWFISSLQVSDMPTTDAVTAHMEFIDSVLANFARAVQFDARNGTDSHEHVWKQLDKANPELVKELAYLTEDRLRQLEASLSRRRSLDTNADPGAKRPKKAPQSTGPKSKGPLRTHDRPHDSAVLHMMAKHEGKQVCLRHLSANGCYSKDPVKCTSDQRIHHVPSESLPAEVVKHIEEKWNGLASKFRYLAP